MKLFKKVSAMVVSLLMALAIVVPVAAANPTITVKNIAADENVTLSYLKVVKQDKTTKTGWAFVDETVAQIFRDEYGKKDDQAILASLANSAAHSKALARLGNLSGFTGFTNNGERKTEVDGAGLYVVKVVDNSNKYTYNVMAAPINFEYANNPATLKNAELAVKRSETRLTKTVNDTDGAVHNGQTVTYTINVKVPSIDPTATNKLFKVTDALTGAEYKKDTVVVKLGDNEINVVPISGCNACLDALVVSGIAPQPFMFYGFLDHLDKKKKKELIDLKKYKETIVFYESPHRIKKTLNLMLDILGDRNIALCREITKKHEEIIRGHISEIISIVEELKGEMVIVVEGSQEVEEEITFETTIKEDVDMYIEKGMSTKDAIKEVAKQRNLNKNSVYQEYHSK